MRARAFMAGAAFVALSSFLLVFGSVGCSRETEHRRFDSLDGAFHVIVFRCTRVFSSAMPGQGSDARGIVRLYDRAGRQLQEADVDMVQNVEHVDWEADRVHIKLIADWPLPD